MIMKGIVDRVRQARIDRERTLRRKKAGILGLGVTIGITVGAVAGVLFAPKAGRETREDLRRRGSEGWGKIKENASHIRHRVGSAIEEKTSRMRMAAKKSVGAADEALKEPTRKEEEGTDLEN